MELVTLNLFLVGGVLAIAIVSVLVALATQRVVAWMRSRGTPLREPVTGSMDEGQTV